MNNKFDYHIERISWDRGLISLAGLAVQSRKHVALLFDGSNVDNHFSIGSAPNGWRILAFDPVLVFQSKGPLCEFNYQTASTRVFGNPWNIFETRFSQFELIPQQLESKPLGGAIGYFGYDMKNSIEPGLPQSAQDDLELPDSFFGFYPAIFAEEFRDGQSNGIFAIATGHDAHGNVSTQNLESNFSNLMSLLDEDCQRNEFSESHSKDSESSDLTSNMDENAFVESVKLAKEYIRQGHIYQVNLSQRLASPKTSLNGSEWDIYLKLLGIMRPEQSVYFDAGSFHLLSSSPEKFLCMRDKTVNTFPIKGTRPRGEDPAIDDLLRNELVKSEKERAELTMITDLMRNDLGRIAEFGSVHVPQFLDLKTIPNVHHMYSMVEGRIRPGLVHLDVLKNCFPGGSITGAPKIRAMQIIDELEPTTRGPYTGSFGYLGFNQVSQFNILIRTTIVQDQNIYYSVGAGIVADSNPHSEYQETWHKAQGFLSALDLQAMTS